MEFLKSNLWEIRKSSALQIFGGLLSFAHLLTYAWWSAQGNLPLLYHGDPNPMCSSLFEDCQWIKFLSGPLMEVAFHSFGILAGLAGVLFFITRLTGTAWFFLTLTLALKLILYVQDLRLHGNIHYLLFALTFCFLYIPSKPLLLRWLLASYYVATGLLDLSPNWLTGQWFVVQFQTVRNIHIPVKLGEWLAAMAVLVQLLAPVALWFSALRHFIIAYLCLVTFHFVMWYSEGFFEPMVMLAVLQIFPLLNYEERKLERESLYQSFIRPDPNQAWVWLMLIVFWSAQILPLVPIPQSVVTRGINEILTLSPVADGGDCRQTAFVVGQNDIEEVAVDPVADRPGAYRCNPYLRFLDLKAFCRSKETDSQFKDLIAFFEVRGLKDASYRMAFQSYNLCNENVTFRSLVGSNEL
jgi:hypothetical protein